MVHKINKESKMQDRKINIMLEINKEMNNFLSKITEKQGYDDKKKLKKNEARIWLRSN